MTMFNLDEEVADSQSPADNSTTETQTTATSAPQTETEVTTTSPEKEVPTSQETSPENDIEYWRNKAKEGELYKERYAASTREFQRLKSTLPQQQNAATQVSSYYPTVSSPAYQPAPQQQLSDDPQVRARELIRQETQAAMAQYSLEQRRMESERRKQDALVNFYTAKLPDPAEANRVEAALREQERIDTITGERVWFDPFQGRFINDPNEAIDMFYGYSRNPGQIMEEGKKQGRQQAISQQIAKKQASVPQGGGSTSSRQPALEITEEDQLQAEIFRISPEEAAKIRIKHSNK